MRSTDNFATVTSIKSKNEVFFLKTKRHLSSQQRPNHTIFRLSSMQCA